MTNNDSSNKKMIVSMITKLKRENKNFSAKRHISCFGHILNFIVQSTIKSYDILILLPLIEEKCDKQLTTSENTSDMNVEEEVDVVTLTSTPM